MISAEHLDSLLEIWARGKLTDGAEYRALYYPSATPEERYARRGGARASPSTASISVTGADIFECVDRSVAKLQSHNDIWYKVLCQRWLNIGPDEHRARRLRLTPERFKSSLNSARRFLRQELGSE